MSFVNGLHFNNIRGDIYGGLTAAVVALPLALAFGVSSGAGPIAGVYGAIIVGFFAALFGGTPAQVSGPTGPMTVVMAVIFTQYTSMFPDDPSHGAALAFTVVIMGGLFQILFGVLKIGRFIELVPHPVTSGFMSGIGVIIILLQLGPLLGHVTAGGPLASAQALPEVFANPVAYAMLLGLLSLVIVFFLPKRINQLIPSPLVALLVGTGMLLLFIPEGKVSLLGEVPTGLPSPQFPVLNMNWSLFTDMVKSALVLATLGTIDSLLTSLVADNITRTHHKSDRELIGQGIGNTVAGFFGGLPGAGATMRTVVNVHAGGRTPLSGALHALILLAVVLGAGGLAQYIPHAVLAGILIKVGTDIIDWDYLKRLRHAPKAGVAIMFVVFFVTVFVDLISAVAIGMVMASFLFLQRMTDLQLKSITAINQPSKEAPLTDHEAAILGKAEGQILLYHMEGPLSFGAAKGMIKRWTEFNDYQALIMDLTDVPALDFTSTRAIDDIISDTLVMDRHVFLVSPRRRVMRFLKNQGIIEKINPDYLHKSRIDALCHAARILGFEPSGCET
ncbi:MAG TPA: SulP family inorganic anion transporter [Acidiferrobacteraceae bacterium]|nr:SulP family inorganic anion transporter [Acidiferrobacteraceae bacterium]